MADLQSTPPVNNSISGEVGIHLNYVRRDIDEIKTILKDTNTKIENIGNSFVSTALFNEHQKDHESRLRVLELERENIVILKRIVYGLVSIVLTAVIVAIVALVIK